jgi:ATP-dependent DNA helicase RecG
MNKVPLSKAPYRDDHFLSHPLKPYLPSQSFLYEKLFGETVFDALAHLPAHVITRKLVTSLTNEDIGLDVVVPVTILTYRTPLRSGGVFRIETVTEKGDCLDLCFFQKNTRYVRHLCPIESKRVIAGKLEKFNGRFSISHPDYIRYPSSVSDLLKPEPIYPLTAGLTSYKVQQILLRLLENVPEVPEWQDGDWLLQNGLSFSPFLKTLQTLHSPLTSADLSNQNPLKMRLLYDELLAHQLALRLRKNQYQAQDGYKISGPGEFYQKILASLPFALTKGQCDALEDIKGDLKKGMLMLRLLQGDVGSGKTLVAVLSISLCIEQGLQAAVLVPTDLLSQQHFYNFKKYFEPLNINVALLTSRIKGKKRQGLLNELEQGKIHILVGTHALLQEHVVFKNLGIVIIDEQHRFGVEQRLLLSQKGKSPHILSMTATPIPRTLQMANFGDLDVTIIPDKPSGRKDIMTSIHSIEKVDEISTKLLTVLCDQTKAYWVCPLIEESETSDFTAVKVRFAELQKIFGDRVGLLHGKLKSEQKEDVMQRFIKGEIHILVSTTVIEVGVDVKEAIYMIIEHAEKFGLAQLHQLRGRVGRNDQQARCLLLYENLFPMAKERLTAMRDSNDGFYLSEKDLKLRGGGEVLGLKQSGIPAFRFFEDNNENVDHFKNLLYLADLDAQNIVKIDPSLQTNRGQRLQFLLKLFRKDRLELTRSG